MPRLKCFGFWAPGWVQVAFVRQHRYAVTCKDQQVGEGRQVPLVEELVIVELKACAELVRQFYFKVPLLKHGIRRIVLTRGFRDALGVLGGSTMGMAV